MNIHEHQAKEILKKYGAAVPNGVFGFSADDVVEKAKKLNTQKYVLKAQIHAGGRGKAGGVKILKNIEDLSKASKEMIGKVLVTPQTGSNGKEVKRLVELSQLMAEAMPEYAKKLPKKELPNFMVKLISYIDSSAKMMIPDLGILMQTDTTYAEELLGFKFKPAKDCMTENAKSVVRLGLV